MIRTRKEYLGAKETLAGLRAGVEAQRAEFQRLGLTPAEIQRGLQPMLGLADQLASELEQYDRWGQGHVAPVSSLAQIGQMLIALRIARGWSQRELADRLGVSESQVSRDERNEYHAIQVDRAQRIFDILGVQVMISPAEQPVGQRAPALTARPP
jgi:DNA-binding Xre family transcriptional regulator